MRTTGLVLAALWALGPAAVFAQQPGQETVSPDRPDVTNGAHLIAPGFVQIEAGAVHTRNSAADHAFGSPIAARIGVRNWVEVAVGTDGLLSQSTGQTRVTGFGNVQLAAKLRLMAASDGQPLVSVLPAVMLPTASEEKGLGSGQADYTATLLTGADVGEHGHVDVNYGIGAIGAGSGQGRFAQHLVSISGSVAVNEHANPYLEVFWLSKQAFDGGAIGATDAGVVYTISRRVAVDGGMQFGISHAAPAFAVFGGFSVLLGEHARVSPAALSRPQQIRGGVE